MKKFIAIILAVLYMGSSTGATIHLHYCMGKLVEQGLWQKEDGCTRCDSEKESSACADDCCKDELKTIKLEKDHKVAEMALQWMQHSSPAIPVSFPAFESAALQSATLEHPVSHAPPRTGKVSTYLFNCNFRI